MKHEMMWAYLIHLSNNMWSDRPDSPKSPFHQTLDLDEATWRQVIDFLPKQGINTVLIDVGDAIQYESPRKLQYPACEAGTGCARSSSTCERSVLPRCAAQAQFQSLP